MLGNRETLWGGWEPRGGCLEPDQGWGAAPGPAKGLGHLGAGSGEPLGRGGKLRGDRIEGPFSESSLWPQRGTWVKGEYRGRGWLSLQGGYPATQGEGSEKAGMNTAGGMSSRGISCGG